MALGKIQAERLLVNLLVTRPDGRLAPTTEPPSKKQRKTAFTDAETNQLKQRTLKGRQLTELQRLEYEAFLTRAAAQQERERIEEEEWQRLQEEAMRVSDGNDD